MGQLHQKKCESLGRKIKENQKQKEMGEDGVTGKVNNKIIVVRIQNWG